MCSVHGPEGIVLSGTASESQEDMDEGPCGGPGRSDSAQKARGRLRGQGGRHCVLGTATQPCQRPAAPSRRGPGDLPFAHPSVSPSAPVAVSPGTAPVPLPGGALLVTWPLTTGAPCVRGRLRCSLDRWGGGGHAFPLSIVATNS